MVSRTHAPSDWDIEMTQTSYVLAFDLMWEMFSETASTAIAAKG